MELKKLKSGSDLRGIALGEETVLTEETARRVGAAFACFLSRKTGKKDIRVALGRDSRLSGESLLTAAAEGIASAGAVAQDYGMCTTPAMYMAILDPRFAPDGSVMITASHHPWQMNGMKFFTRDGGIGHEELDELISLAEGPLSPAEGGKVEKVDFLPAYADGLKRIIRETIGTDGPRPLEGLHVTVDAGNGAGGFYARLLSELGARTDGSRFLEPDGRFPGHIPNPENKDAMAAVSEAVTSSGADLGVIFDADCDRAAIVDETGREINRNRLIAMISRILIEQSPGATIVTDSVTSSGLAEFITALGGTHYRFKRGYRNVIDEAVRLNAEGIDCPLAIETSGHAALRQNHFLDDGMYLVTLLICRAYLLKKQGEKIGKLLDGLRESVESAEIRLPVLKEDFAPYARRVIDEVTALAQLRRGWTPAADNHEGIRVSVEMDGNPTACWFLLRLSVHDPVMPINAESDVPGGVKLALSELYKVLKPCEGLDLSPLQRAVEG